MDSEKSTEQSFQRERKKFCFMYNFFTFFKYIFGIIVIQNPFS